MDKMQTIDAVIHAVAADSGCSQVTVQRYLLGVVVRGASSMRIERSLRKIKRADLVRMRDGQGR